jgi:hypothetical protein
MLYTDDPKTMSDQQNQPGAISQSQNPGISSNQKADGVRVSSRRFGIRRNLFPL